MRNCFSPISRRILLPICFLLYFLLFKNYTVEASIAKGDIAVIGFNCDPSTSLSKTFAVVALADISAGEVINFSDKAYYSNAFSSLLPNGSEGRFSWTVASGGIGKGTVIMFTITSGASPSVATTPSLGTCSVIEGWTNTNATQSPFGQNGDAILIYQGTEASPSFIFGFNDGNNTTGINNGWNTGLSSNPNNATELPTSLTNGTYAIGFGGSEHIDNLRYNGVRVGTKASLLTEICKKSNWVTDDITPYDLIPETGAFNGTNPIFTLTNPNTAPVFSNATTILSVCQNSNAASINSLLQITDADAAQTETYTITSNPTNGTITTGTTVSSGTNVSPTGWSYTPTNGYSGSDAFTIQVSDGSGGTATKTITVTINSGTSSTTNLSICSNELPYSWNGLNFNGAGSQTYHTSNAIGCDSAATLNLTVKSTSASIANISICSSELPYNWNGSKTSAGTYTYTTTNSQGCDSISTLNLTIKNNYSITSNAVSNGSISPNGTITICEGGSQTCNISANSGYSIADVLIDGGSVGAVSTYTFSNVTANHTISATFVANCTPTTSSTTHSACGSYMWNGQLYMSNGTYTYHTTNAAGCDSAATLNLTINQASISTYAYDTICSSQLPYTWLGKTFNALGSQPLFLQNAKGCDSVVTLVLAVKQTTSSTTNLSVYATQLPYSWNGLTFATAGTQIAHLTNAAGCDSAATLVLSIAPPACVPTASNSSENICSNLLPYNWNGLTFTTAGTQTAHLTNAGGCDSAATLILTTKASPIVASITNNGVNSISTANLCTTGATYKYYNNTPYGVWSSSNAIVASVTGGSQAGVVTANNNGTTTISYTVTNSTGCSASANLQVTVAVQSTPNAITGLSKVCAGSSITLSNTTADGVWSTQQTSQATVNAATGLLLGKNAGTVIINYTVTNTSGCSALVSKNITVNALPAVPIITYSAASAAIRSQFTYNGNFCNGKSFTAEGIPTGGNWAYTNPLVGIISPTGVVNLIGVGSGAVIYTITDANGCSNSRTMPGTVANCPIPKGINTVDGQQSTIDGITMYPNPARSFISLNVESLVGAGSIVITDLYGKVIKKQALSMGTNNVDIAILAKGMYLVSVITNEGKATKKLIVE